MMKIQVTQYMLTRILDHYRDAIYNKFPSKLLTPATLHEMEMFLRGYQQRVIQRETHPGWAMALKLVFDPRRGAVDVEPDAQAGVEVVG